MVLQEIVRHTFGLWAPARPPRGQPHAQLPGHRAEAGLCVEQRGHPQRHLGGPDRQVSVHRDADVPGKRDRRRVQRRRQQRRTPVTGERPDVLFEAGLAHRPPQRNGSGGRHLDDGHRFRGHRRQVVHVPQELPAQRHRRDEHVPRPKLPRLPRRLLGPRRQDLPLVETTAKSERKFANTTIGTVSVTALLLRSPHGRPRSAWDHLLSLGCGSPREAST